jgi:predicted glycoside hydrolase/deacetylase ChbG (UPF0249 family)
LRSSRLLVVNADDFGFTADVNRGIIEAHRNGILTATTLMANGRAFDDALQRARENPSLDIGCHLVLIGGESVADPRRPLPASVPELVRAVGLSRLSVHEELAAQLRRLLAAGIRPTHLDTHKHTHLLPAILSAVARVSRAFGIPWIRKPLPVPVLGSLLEWRLRRNGCRTTDHFAGFSLTGRFGTAELVRSMKGLHDGVTEFMCHPGFCGEELRGAHTRLKESRVRELEALTAPETRRTIEEEQIRLVSYRDL